jgi:hypothetical protein
MQYYSEEKMHSLRLSLEKEILSWPNVTTRKMYRYSFIIERSTRLRTEGILSRSKKKQRSIALESVFDSLPHLHLFSLKLLCTTS